MEAEAMSLGECEGVTMGNCASFLCLTSLFLSLRPLLTLAAKNENEKAGSHGCFLLHLVQCARRVRLCTAFSAEDDAGTFGPQ